MAKTLHIAVNDKVATYCQRDGVIVCGNSDYEIEFAFDSEWSSHAVKTARFIHGKTYEDVVFEGNTVAVPVMRGITSLAVGVFSGNLKTTTPAIITCRKSVLCEGGSPSEPTPDVYAQIIELLNKGGGGGGSGNDGDVQTLEEMLQGFEKDPGSVKKYVDSFAGTAGGHYTPDVKDNGDGTMTVSFTANKDGMAAVSPVTVTLPKGADGAHVIAVDEMGGDDTKTTYKMLFSDGSGYDFDVYHGHDGDDGVGIASVVQTTTSTADGGENVITVTLTDNTQTTFKVKNGSKGSAGRGISKVEKTSTSDLTDTYTITYTDNTTSTFIVVNGKDGSNGVGIKTIAQTTTSSEDGGENVITVTLTNNTQSTFKVKNGSKGSKGDAGNGIKSIAKTSTSGLADTYTITFTDNTTATFTVTNGEVGATYTPHFSADGTLYWTNSGDLPNPAPVNLIDLMRNELGLEDNAGETVEYESFATEAELVAGGDTSKLYIVEETGTLWAYQEVELGEVRKQIFDPESKIAGHMSGTKISSSSNDLFLLPVDTSKIPEGEVARLEINGIYKKTSSSTPKSQKIGYSALTPDSIEVAENQLIKCFYTETRATAGTDYPTEEEISETSAGITVKIGYFSGTILDGYNTIKTLLIEFNGTVSNASSITAYLVHDGGTTQKWVDTGEAPPAPGTNTNYTELLLRVNAAEDELEKHDKRITKQETQSDTTETYDDYWQTAYDAAVAKVKAKQDEGGVNVECFVWFSDFHYYSHTSSKHLLNVGRLSAAIMDECDIPFAVLSGDTLTAATLETEAKVRQALQGAMTLLSPIGQDRLLLARGNHDDVYGRVYNDDGTTKATYVNKVSAPVIYNELHRWQAKDSRRVFGDESGTYFYVDTPQHTRHIILNCQHYDGGAITNGTTNAMTTGMGEAQLAWLKDKALAVEDGMTVTITLHVPPTSQNINNHTYWIDGWPTDANAFRKIVQESTADIAAIFCGHCHADAVVSGDLRCPIITTTCAINTPYDADPATRVIGTDTETAINIVCVNKGARKIDVIRLGYGADRLNVSY